jgi:hypothetical protein
MNRNVGIVAGVIVVVVIAGAVIYWRNANASRPIVNPPKGDLIYLGKDLDAQERQEFYHLAEGSELYPVLWMRALKTKDDKYFLDDAERIGFLADPDNEHGLPIGLTHGVTRGLEPLGPMSGLNCAACHVGELHYKGKRVRIDGAPNLLNTRSSSCSSSPPWTRPKILPS